MKHCDIFLISAQNIDCGYSLEPPNYFTLQKWSSRGSELYRRVFVMDSACAISEDQTYSVNKYESYFSSDMPNGKRTVNV